MPEPHMTKKMRLDVNGTILDFVELVNIEVGHEGGVESKYGQTWTGTQYKPWNRHKVGMHRVRFTIRRWYKAGVSDDILYDLYDNDTEFTLKEYLNDITGEMNGVEIYQCQIYRYTPETGTPNDIVIEEANGEGLTWGEEIITTPPPCTPTECIINGGFETNDTWHTTTGWDDGSGGGASVTSADAHGGSWSDFCYSQGILQAIDLDIPVSAITTFGFWYNGIDGSACFKIYYTDATDSGWIFFATESSWTYVDIIPYLAVGKSVKNIEIHGGLGTPIYVDDVSLIACI